MAVGQCPAGATGAGGERHLPDTDHLISQVDRHVARLRATRGQHDLALAERLAGCLRQLILDTASSCATDRARVRAAVRYFVLRRRPGTTGCPSAASPPISGLSATSPASSAATTWPTP